MALEEILATPDAARQEVVDVTLPECSSTALQEEASLQKTSWKHASTHLEEAIGGNCWIASRKCDEKAAQSRRRGRRRTVSDDVEKRALRAELLVPVGELSAARQALEGAAIRSSKSCQV